MQDATSDTRRGSPCDRLTSSAVLCSWLRRYNDDLVRALKAEPQNSVVNAQFQFCIELTTLLFSEGGRNTPRGNSPVSIW